MAEQLAKDAEAYDESLSEAEKQKMQDRLKAAERLLESMAGTQWTTMSSGGGPGAGHVYTNDPHASPAEAARLLARQFWSMALKGKERRSRPVEQEASDVEFFEAENRVLRECGEIRVAGCRKMIFTDYPGHFVALGLVLGTAAIVLVAFRQGPLQTPQRGRYRGILAALHYAAVLLVLAILWNPSAWQKKETFGRNTVLAVFDTSESMSVADDGRTSRLDKSLSRFAECLDRAGGDGPRVPRLRFR